MLILCPTTTIPSEEPTLWDWVRSEDGSSVAEQGCATADQLRPHGECVLILPPTSVRWHHIALPAHPPAKRVAVLKSVLEEAVLSDLDDLHACLLQAPVAGQPQWCAVTSKSKLIRWLQTLQSAGLTPSRILPMLTPQSEPLAWVWPRDSSWQLSVCDPHGVSHWGSEQQDWPDALLAPSVIESLPVYCPSKLAQNLESHWPEVRLQVRSTAAWLLDRARVPWDLAQGEFKVHPAQRYLQAASRWWTEVRHAPQWRMTRWGLVVSLLAMLAAPPVVAWRINHDLDQLQRAAQDLVKQTFADTTLVIDPIKQMERSLAQLAARKGGTTGPQFTSALSALGQIKGLKVTQLRTSDGVQWQLQIAGPLQVEAIRSGLAAAGWQGTPQAAGVWLIQPLKSGATS